MFVFFPFAQFRKFFLNINCIYSDGVVNTISISFSSQQLLHIFYFWTRKNWTNHSLKESFVKETCLIRQISNNRSFWPSPTVCRFIFTRVQLRFPSLVAYLGGKCVKIDWRAEDRENEQTNERWFIYQFYRKQRLVRGNCNSKFPHKVFESSRFILLI